MWKLQPLTGRNDTFEIYLLLSYKAMFHHPGSVHKQDIKLWAERTPILVWNSSVSCQNEHFTALPKTKVYGVVFAESTICGFVCRGNDCG